MAAHNNFEWFRGEDVVITFTHTAGVDITNWNISFKMRTTVGNPNTIVTIPAIVTSGLPPVYTVTVSSALNTTTIASGQYAHSAARTDPGSVAVLSEGPVLVKPSAQLA